MATVSCFFLQSHEHESVASSDQDSQFSDQLLLSFDLRLFELLVKKAEERHKPVINRTQTLRHMLTSIGRRILGVSQDTQIQGHCVTTSAFIGRM